MADIYKNSREAGAEVRGIGQGNRYEPGAIYKGLTGSDYEPGDVYKNGVPSGRTAISQPTASTPTSNVNQYDAFNASLAAAQEAQAAPPPAEEPGIIDSAVKGMKSVKVTWDFLANKLENAVTGDGSTTAPILQQSVEEYKAMASDPRIQEMIQLGNDAPGYYAAGKEMLTYAARNPGLIANFIAEQGAAVVASLPLGGVGGRIVGAGVARTALGTAAKEATVMGATGASINASAVVLGALGTNYVEGLDKFKGDKDAAADYAATKTLSEVPANAVAGMFLGVNPFSRMAASSPMASAAGNVAFQTGVQGAGGGVGAVQAAQSVGEEAGKGEILAEIFGEGVLAPIDLVQARSEAKRGVTPPGQSSVTVEQAPKEFDNAQPLNQTSSPAPVQDQDTSRLSDVEFKSATSSPAFMAAMYSRADDATRAQLRAVNPGLNLDVLVQDANLVMDGFKMADNGTGPEFVNMFNQAVADYKAPATAQPPFDGGTKVDTAPEDFVPPREKLRLAADLAAEGQMFAAGEQITKEKADAIKAQKAEPAVVQEPVQEVAPKVEPVVEATANAEADTPVASQPGPLTQLAQVEQQIADRPRFGLPSTISAADSTYVVEVGPTGKKRKDESPVNAFVSNQGKVIKIDADAIIKQYGSEPWTAPKVEGVTALPKDSFNSPEQWLDFVFKHEAAHIANPKKDGETTGAYENRINEIALVQVKGQDFANSVYQAPAQAEVKADPTPAAQESNVAEGLRPVEATASPDPAPAPVAAQPKKKAATKRKKFEEVKNEAAKATTVEAVPQDNKAEPIPENKTDAVEPVSEQSRPEQNPVEVQKQEPSPVEVREAAAQKVVSDEVPELVGPTRDRLYTDAAERLDLIPKILQKYEYKQRPKQREILKKKNLEELRAFWKKVSGRKDIEPKRFEKEANQFDDDTGGVMSNMARSGAMGLDAIAELGNKERVEAARRAQLEEEVRQSTKEMNTRAKEAAKGITDPELKTLADTQQQEIGGTTVGGGLINPIGAVGLQSDIAPINAVTQDEIDAVNAQVDAQGVALRIVEAVQAGEITPLQAKQRARDEGVGTYDFVNAMRTYGVDPTADDINQSGAIAANNTLRSYVRDSGLRGYQAREMWLKSYDNLKNKDAVELTKTERAAYDNWKSKRVQYQQRLNRSVQENSQNNAGTLDDTFPNVLFTQFSLSEMRNPGSIPEPMRSVVTDLFSDPATAWFDDIATVLSLRPDFEGQVNDLLTKDEKAAYDEYRNKQLREAFRNAEMISKSPAYSQLDQLRFLSPEMFTQYSTQIRLAEQNQLAQILHEASEMNDRAQAAIEAGVAPDNTLDAQMREYMLRDAAMSKNLDDFSEDGSFNEEDNDGTALYKRGYYSGAVTALTVQEHLSNQFAGWETQPEYTVAQNVNQLPADVKTRLTSRIQNGAFKGALDPKTGHIYLFSDFMENVADAEFTMFHELYGHWGMRAFLGDKMDAFLENQYKLNRSVASAADKIRAESDTPMGRLESVEEAISDMAASGDPSLFRQIMGQLTAWLKKNGFETVAQWIDKSGEAELAHILSQAKKAARGQGISPMDGAPSGVRYAASKIPVEIYATRDNKTTGYARQNPINGFWTVFSIQDVKTGEFGAQTVESYTDALEFLKKVGTVVRAKDRATRLDTNPSQFVTVPDKRQMVNEPSKAKLRRWARQAQIKAQNKYLPIFEFVEFMKSKGKQTDLINRLKLIEGKTKYFVENFEVDYQVPILRAIKEIGAKGGTVDDIDLFLIARHAEERNKVISDVTGGKNKTGSGMGPKSRTLENGDVIPGYIQVLREASDKPYAAELETIGSLMDQLSREKANYMLAHGQIDQKTFDAINNYEHYVTLSGNATDMEFVDTESLGGRAMNLRGSDAKRALGRGTLPVDVLQNTMNSYLSTVVRGQKNLVAQSFTQLVEEANDPNFAVVEEIKTTKSLNTERLFADKAVLKVIGDAPTEVSGKQFLENLAFKVKDGQLDADEAVQTLRERIREAEARRDIEPEAATAAINRINEQAVIAGRLSENGYVTDVERDVGNEKNVFVAKFDGKPVKIMFKEKGMEVLESLSGAAKVNPSSTLEAIGSWTRFFSQLVTSWNPAWVAVNGLRDFQTVLTNMATDPRVGVRLAGEMKKAWTQSFVTAFKSQYAEQGLKSDGYWGKFLNKMAEKHPISQEEQMYLDEFKKNGAETFFFDRDRFELTLEKMDRHLNPDKGIWAMTKDGASTVGDFIELLSMPMETAPRFAVYKTLRKNGWSVEDAAVYAKEVSVNFNMQGASSWIRQLFVFANPTIQGNVRLYQDYSRTKTGAGKFLPSNRFAAVMAQWVMLGMVGNFIARALGGEDDDLEGMDKLDQVPHHKRSTSLILAPGVPGAAIPIAYGANVYFTLGHYLVDVMTGKMSADKAAIRVGKTAFDSFSPIGSGVDSQSVGGAVAKTLSPSIAVPIIEIAMNENRFGAPIYKDNKFSDVQEADSYLNFDSANVLSTSLFRGLNSATGGTRYKSGVIDINPATFDYMLTSYLPGVVSEVYKGADLAARKAKGLDTKETPIPLVDRLTAKVPEQWDAGAMRSAKAIVDTRFKELTAPDTTEARKKEILKEHPTLGNAKAVLQSTDQQMKTMRRNLEAIERDPKNSDAMKVEARNYYKDLEKKVIHRAVEATLKAGFKSELIGD